MAGLTLLDLLILSLATWRLGYFISRETGPFSLAKRLREKYPLGGLTTCLYCASFWCAVLFFGLWLTPLRVIVYPFAIAGLALMAGQYTGLNQQ